MPCCPLAIWGSSFDRAVFAIKRTRPTEPIPGAEDLRGRIMDAGRQRALRFLENDFQSRDVLSRLISERACSLIVGGRDHSRRQPRHRPGYLAGY